MSRMRALPAGFIAPCLPTKTDKLPSGSQWRRIRFAITVGSSPGFASSLPIGRPWRSVTTTLPGYEATVWTGVGAPRGTPPEIIERLNREINAGLANPTIKARLAQVATTPKIFTPAKFGDHVVAEIEEWGRVIEFDGIRAE